MYSNDMCIVWNAECVKIVFASKKTPLRKRERGESVSEKTNTITIYYWLTEYQFKISTTNWQQ